MPTLSANDFNLLASHVRDISGIELDPAKQYLVDIQVNPLLEELKLPSIQALCLRSRQDSSGRLGRMLIDAVSINETSFFRERTPFELIKHKLIPEALDRIGESREPSRPVRIWSAAASTGQEAYSIAMAATELLGTQEALKRIQITGSDISDAAIRRASAGIYTETEMGRGLPANFKDKYFLKSDKGWAIKPEIRAMAKFEVRSLLSNLSLAGSFDIVLCRYVAIYFSPKNRIQVFSQISKQIRPGGSLIIGRAERLPEEVTGLEKQWHHACTYFQVPS